MCYRQMVKTERKAPLTIYIFFLLLPLEWSLKTIDPVAHQGPGNLLGEEALLSRKNWLAIGDDFVFMDLFPQA